MYSVSFKTLFAFFGAMGSIGLMYSLAFIEMLAVGRTAWNAFTIDTLMLVLVLYPLSDWMCIKEDKFKAEGK